MGNQRRYRNKVGQEDKAGQRLIEGKSREIAPATPPS